MPHLQNIQIHIVPISSKIPLHGFASVPWPLQFDGVCLRELLGRYKGCVNCRESRVNGWDLVAWGGQKGEVGRGQQDLSSLEPKGSDYVRVMSTCHVVCVCVCVRFSFYTEVYIVIFLLLK